MAEKQSVMEELNASDQMAWVGAINNIRAYVNEIVLSELIGSLSIVGVNLKMEFCATVFKLTLFCIGYTKLDRK